MKAWPLVGLVAFSSLLLLPPNSLAIYQQDDEAFVFQVQPLSELKQQQELLAPNPPEPEPKPEPKWETIRVVTAYSSSRDETDDTPFITASQTRVRDGVVAANWLPLGTRIQIPQIFGEKILVVEDRMNKRYTNRVDIWMPTKAQAKEFGKKTARIMIID
jgi:3D (Asp-Asp-Asp) domain-containing protein